MILKRLIEKWQIKMPWKSLTMVEQDLIISRALVDLYSHPKIRDTLIFRGGTALNKIYINPPARYSEDIDLVKINAGPIGETIDNIRSVLDNWLGKPKRKLSNRSAKLIYSYQAFDKSQAKLKIEINTVENFHLQELRSVKFNVSSEWFTGESNISTYSLSELMATKLRALYQRRKGRDLFDLWLILKRNLIDIDTTMFMFNEYCKHSKNFISRDLFEENLTEKRRHKDFQTDIHPLLHPDIQWNFNEAFDLVYEKFIKKLN